MIEIMIARFTGILWGVFLLFLTTTSGALAQQPTFGPICDGVTVTCAPTQTPTPTIVGGATATPTTVLPTELPRAAGYTGMTITLTGMGGLLFLFGITSVFSLRPYPRK